MDAGVWQPTGLGRVLLYFEAQLLNQEITNAVLAGYPIPLDAGQLPPLNTRIKQCNYDTRFESGSSQVGMAASHLHEVSAENLALLVTIASSMTRLARAVS